LIKSLAIGGWVPRSGNQASKQNVKHPHKRLKSEYWQEGKNPLRAGGAEGGWGEINGWEGKWWVRGAIIESNPRHEPAGINP